MTPAALEVRDLRVRLGRAEVVRGVSLAVAPGRVLGLVGPNGAGKTTVVDAVCGFVACTGRVWVGGQAVDGLRPHHRAALGVSRTFQSLELFEDLTVGENLAVAAEAGRRRPGAPGGRAGRAGTAAGRVRRAVAAAGLDDVVDALPCSLSHGRRKGVALGRALAADPSVLLLDEPAAGLDGVGRAALVATVRAVAAAGTAVVLVDHDVRLVLDVCDEVAVLDQGRLVVSGPPARVAADPAVSAAWLGPVPPAALATTAGAPATHTATAPADPVSGTATEPVAATAGPATSPATGPATGGSTGAAGGAPVLELGGLDAGWGGTAVVHALDLVVGAGEVVALLGANGAGKTTTLLTVSGVLPALGGTASVLGRPVAGGPDAMARRGVAHAPQDRGLLATLTVAEQLRLAAPRAGGRAAVDAALDRLPALRRLAGRRAGLLSGGEQQQLSLARAVAARPRLLLVDELSAGLAPPLVGHALDLLRALADEEGTAVLVVEQLAPRALVVADRACVLHRGRVVAAGAAATLAAHPDLMADAYLGLRQGR
ncbi:MAG: ATP-binding cassette domain-containing protein [Acidimicrobiales bacterium]